MHQGTLQAVHLNYSFWQAYFQQPISLRFLFRLSSHSSQLTFSFPLLLSSQPVPSFPMLPSSQPFSSFPLPLSSQLFPLSLLFLSLRLFSSPQFSSLLSFSPRSSFPSSLPVCRRILRLPEPVL